jgi:protein-S-isoprenylcysteine O-methyltransferase Ste14
LAARYHHRHARADLIGEHRLGHAGQVFFAILFGAVWILDTFVLNWTTFVNNYVPDWVQMGLGFPLLLIGGILAVVSIQAVFGKERDPPAVLRSGLFAYLRHPTYFSEVLGYAGLLALSVSLAAAVVWIGAIVFLRALCRHEERLLLDRFGDEYRDYLRDVPMWIPRLRRRKR